MKRESQNGGELERMSGGNSLRKSVSKVMSGRISVIREGVPLS